MKLKKTLCTANLAILGILFSFPAFAYQHKQTVSTTPSATASTFSLQNGLKLTLGGYIQADASIFRGDAENLQSGTKIPNTQIALTAQYGQHWELNLSYNLADTGSNISNGLDTANIDYIFNPLFTLELGQFSPAFGLENDSDIPAFTFIQGALPVNTFFPQYGQGVTSSLASQSMAGTISVFGPGTQQQNAGTSGHSPYGATLRLFFAPAHTSTEVLHFGLSGWFQQSDGSKTISFSTTPESNPVNDGTLLNTGEINNTDDFKSLDGEFALEHGPWEAQAEYFKTWLNRESGNSDPNFNGYYLTTSYFFTGESRTYSFPAGAFTGISKINSRAGAWQAALRYSKLNLKNSGINGGEEDNTTLGLNWYANQHIEFMLNYIRANADPASDGTNKTANIGALQAQVTF